MTDLAQQQLDAWEEVRGKIARFHLLTQTDDATFDDFRAVTEAQRKLKDLIDPPPPPVKTGRGDADALFIARGLIMGIMALDTYPRANQDNPVAHDATCTMICALDTLLRLAVEGPANG